MSFLSAVTVSVKCKIWIFKFFSKKTIIEKIETFEVFKSFFVKKLKNLGFYKQPHSTALGWWRETRQLLFQQLADDDDCAADNGR